MRKKFLINLFFLGFLFVCGCASAVRIDTRKVSLNEVVKIVESNLPAGRRSVSSNGRTFLSNYFVRGKEGEFTPANNAPIRHYARIVVLGDRRPYTIEVEVITEKRETGGQYDHFKYDEGLARVISRRIEKQLYQRREDRNIVDDFRIF